MTFSSAQPERPSRRRLAAPREAARAKACGSADRGRSGLASDLQKTPVCPQSRATLQGAARLGANIGRIAVATRSLWMLTALVLSLAKIGAACAASPSVADVIAQVLWRMGVG